MNLPKAAAFAAALLIGNAAGYAAAQSEPSATVVEFESPLANRQPLQGLLRQTNSSGPSPAVVLFHGCNGNWRQLDERWAKRIASWGYVTLTVDSFGPRAIQNTCASAAPVDLAFDAYRALNFLVQRPFIDPARVAALGFSQGGWLVLSSIEHGIIEQTSQNKSRVAIAFYPPCRAFNGNMTVPTLILIGELDDWTSAEECRTMMDGRDDWGISRQRIEGRPGPDHRLSRRLSCLRRPQASAAFHGFGHHLEFSQSATDQSVDACATLEGTHREKVKRAVTIKAVVFDADGMLVDIQSVAVVTEKEGSPGRLAKLPPIFWRDQAAGRYLCAADATLRGLFRDHAGFADRRCAASDRSATPMCRSQSWRSIDPT